MGLVSWVAVGALAGLLARWFAPRSAPDGFVVSVPLCISGASVGGFIVGIPGGPWATSSVSEGVVTGLHAPCWSCAVARETGQDVTPPKSGTFEVEEVRGRRWLD